MFDLTDEEIDESVRAAEDCMVGADRVLCIGCQQMVCDHMSCMFIDPDKKVQFICHDCAKTMARAMVRTIVN